MFRILISLFCIIFICQDILFASDDERVNEIFQNINNRYYHLKREGVKDLSCTVKYLPLEKLIKDNDKLAKSDVSIKLYWKYPHKQKAVVSGFPLEMDDERQRLEEIIIMNYGNMIVSNMLTDKLKDYNISVQKEGDYEKLTAVPLTPNDNVSQYVIWIDNNYNIPKMEIMIGELNVSIAFNYLMKDNKLLIPEIKETIGKKMRTKIIEYSSVDGFWVISKISIFQFNEKGTPQRVNNPIIANFVDYKINKGLDDKIFDN